MPEPDFVQLAELHQLGDEPIPPIVLDLADGDDVELVWRNELGGLTFRAGDRYVKWNPRRTGIDLERERVRLGWIATRHPAPEVVTAGDDGEAQWLVTRALPGESAVGDTWRARRSEAIARIAAGLRAIHALPIDEFPPVWAARGVGRPPADGPSAPGRRSTSPSSSTATPAPPTPSISAAGEWTGNVDFGDLGVGDRWADLAIASLSLDWNFGEGHQPELFDAYGIEPDEHRIRYYRALWEQES